MKKLYAVLLIILVLTGCNLDSFLIEEDMDFIEEISDTENKRKDPLENYPKLDENLKAQLRELYGLWGEFYSVIRHDVDPSEDFHNSKYLAELKNFLSKKESLAASNELRWILEQGGFKSMDKQIILSNGKDYNIRLIIYIVDYYTPMISHTLVPNKLAFIQCWNDDNFYFTMLSESDVHTVLDFYPMEIDGELHIILLGKTFPFYLHTPFLWAWRLDAEGFKQSEVFNFKSDERDKYFIYDSVDIDNNLCLLKWTFHTDGAFIMVERRMDYGRDIFSDYLYVGCDVLEDGKMFLFTASDNLGEKIEPTIQISFMNGRFVIE